MAHEPVLHVGGPFLVGEPRKHYNDLELHYCETHGERWLHNDAWFSGIAWQELRGELNEDTMVDGQPHGRCVRFHANGRMAIDAYYHEDCPVGEHQQWYDTGAIDKREIYGEFGAVLTQEFNESGQIVREYDSRGDRTHRMWYEDGSLLFESQGGTEACYASDGSVAFRGPEDGDPLFFDDVLHDRADELFDVESAFVMNRMFAWLHRQLDNNPTRGKQLLFDLTDHPRDSVAETTMDIIGIRQYKDAIRIVREHTRSNRRKLPLAAAFIGTFAELAETTLVKLTVPETEQHRALDELSEKRRLRQEVEKRQSEHDRRDESKDWPEAIARYVETQVSEFTLKTGDQVLSDDCISRSYDYYHFYEYEVAGATYRAIAKSTEKGDAAAEISIRCRPNSPANYVVS